MPPWCGLLVPPRLDRKIETWLPARVASRAETLPCLGPGWCPVATGTGEPGTVALTRCRRKSLLPIVEKAAGQPVVGVETGTTPVVKSGAPSGLFRKELVDRLKG